MCFVVQHTMRVSRKAYKTEICFEILELSNMIHTSLYSLLNVRISVGNFISIFFDQARSPIIATSIS